MRPLKSKDASDLVFKPEDFVTVSVKFTRVGYAQLKSQEFPTPSTWERTLPPTEELEAYARAETGMKLSCGLEMLLYDPHHQDKASVREMKMILGDIDDGEEQLPMNSEIEKWDKREDDEKWLDINFEDLDRELKGGGKNKEKSGGDFGDSGAQENLQRIVARFEEFLNDNSAGFDGADFIDDFGSDSDLDEDDDDDDVSSDGEDKDASFDEEEFSRMMKEMMGMPSGPGKPSFKALGKRVQDLDTDEEDDTEQIKELSRQMEAELRGTGVLDLNRKQQKLASGEIPFQENATEPSNSHDSEDYDEDNNANINLAKNLLESLHGQAGTAGPAGNMLSMMGLRMPKDDRQ